ncbi:Uncharacterized protein MLTONO_p0542 (plasmid) [Mesorhizobium loti]|nr:Uncharacterized protein MLTONO_p0542 [Mesorhizobium loti]
MDLPPVVETQEQKRQPVQPPKKRRRYLYLLIPLALLVAGGGYYIAVTKGWFNKPEPLLARFERLKLTDADGVELFALSGEAYREGDGGIGLQNQSCDGTGQQGREASGPNSVRLHE